MRDLTVTPASIKGMSTLAAAYHFLTRMAALLPVCLALLALPATAQKKGALTGTTEIKFKGQAATIESVPFTENQPSTALVFSANGAVDWDITNIVSLEIDEESMKVIPDLNDFDVSVQVEYGDGVSSPTVLTRNFTVGYKAGEGQKYNAKNYLVFTGAKYMRLTIMTVPPPVSGFNLKDILVLRGKMVVDRWYQMQANPTPYSFVGAVQKADELAVSWAAGPDSYGRNGFQLEWAWADDEMAGEYGTPGTAGFYENVFRDNSTRVDLPVTKTGYDIPLFYDGAGYLYYRLRAVNSLEGKREDGQWSAVGSLHLTQGHNESLNWQVRTSFAEEGKRKTVMEYFDGGLRSRETLTKDGTTKAVIAAETLYDGEGRPAVQILPAPILGASGIQNVIQYTEGLNLFNGQASNQNPSAFFDLVPKTSNTVVAMQQTSGTNKYYSANNTAAVASPGTDSYIPSALGRAFSVTRYTPDATGRPMAQGGVGTTHQMGGGHDTRYFYGTPSQEELDGLFGTEVGNYTHYFKNMVLDANGQASVSYVDMHGRTIATALAGDGPKTSNTEVPANRDILLPVNNTTDYPNQTQGQATRNLLDNLTNLPKDNRLLESVTSLIVPKAASYTFDYALTPKSLPFSDCQENGFCLAQIYNIEIVITDESGVAAQTIKRFTGMPQNGKVSVTCPVGSPGFWSANADWVAGGGKLNPIPSVTVSLAAGSYSVRKTLYINESALQQYKAFFLEKAVCKSLKQLTDSIYETVDCEAEQAVPTCQSCTAGLADFSTDFLAGLGYTDPAAAPPAVIRERDAAYQSAQKACGLLCEQPAAVVATKRSMMLGDMIPFAGQYATKIPGPPTSDLFKLFNIFSETGPGVNPRPFYKNPKEADETYHDQYGNPDVSIPASKLGGMSPTDFAAAFSPSWAEALLPYHPEYARLQYAGSPTMAPSYAWIYDFNKAETYIDAASFIGTSASAVANNDPFYSLESAGKAEMVGWLGTNYMNQGIDMWKIAWGNVNCREYIDKDQRVACFLGAPSFPYGSLGAAMQDAIWKEFKRLYTAERDQHVNAHIAQHEPLAEEQDLLDAGYVLHFPRNNKQIFNQSTDPGEDWSWFPDGYEPGQRPPVNVDVYEEGKELREAGCEGYIATWRETLLQCPALVGTAKEAIVNEIISRMLAVCKKGVNATNPYGSSSVPPSTPVVTGEDRDFEEIVKDVFQYNNISLDYVCNPYSVQAPGPYGLNRPAVKESIAVLDTCACNQFAKVKEEAGVAGFTQLNAYLKGKYNEEISQVLYDAMTSKCASLKDTVCTVVYENISQEPEACNASFSLPVFVENFVQTSVSFLPFDAVTGNQPNYYFVTESNSEKVLSPHMSSPKWSNSIEPWMTQYSSVSPTGISVSPATVFPNELSVYFDFDVQSGYQLNFAGFDLYGDIQDYEWCNLIIDNEVIYNLQAPWDYHIGFGFRFNPENQLRMTGHIRFEIQFHTPRYFSNGDFQNLLQSVRLYGCLTQVSPPTLQATTCASKFIYPDNGNIPDGPSTQQPNTCPVYYCHDTAYAYPLPTPQPLPEFLKCGFEGRKRCYTCDEMRGLLTTFRQAMPSPESDGPVLTLNTVLNQTQIQQNVLFANYVNFKTGMNYSWADYANALLSKDCALAATNNGGSTVICRNDKALNDQPELFTKETPCQKAYAKAAALANEIYNARIKALADGFEEGYRSSALNLAPGAETFTVTYTPVEYHYTLYYYDQAGNLVQTVPPKGVVPDYSPSFLASVRSARTSEGYVVPEHTFKTRYLYNSLNQVAWQKTPDAGNSHFMYDKLGRLVISQNAKQAVNNDYSYTLYDKLGRIWEVGQKRNSANLMDQLKSQDPVQLKNWLNDGLTGAFARSQVTRTVYDLKMDFNGNAPEGGQYDQYNLRNRVSYSQVIGTDPTSLSFLDVPATSGSYQSATYYTYDVHGNVDKLVQHYQEGVLFNSGGTARPYQFKVVKYDYDLVSGKVNRVSFQPGEADAYYHKYDYDNENRLTGVWAGPDRFLLSSEKEASYQYYQHGPLARTVLGQQMVQGLDYYYTLQGWLRGVNSTRLDISTDPGRDALATGINAKVAKDEMGFALYYHQNDYAAIKASNNTTIYRPNPVLVPVSGNANADLYAPQFNGNIAAMVTNIGKLTTPVNPGTRTNTEMTYLYKYDQLNRLRASYAFPVVKQSNNTVEWTEGDMRAGDLVNALEEFKYDPNGNITSLKRRGFASQNSSAEMDNLAYNYIPGTNKLTQVTENPSNDANFPVGTGIRSGQVANNYQYDAIGNLIYDNQEGITSISWTVYGKISSITKSDGTVIAYTYDAAGNRITKTVTQSGTTTETCYVRDAQGNTLAVYTKAASANSGHLTQSEVYLYGSSRLGSVQRNLDVQSPPVGSEDITIAGATLTQGKVYTFTRGNKFFELSNHLGNVLAVVSDRKIRVAKTSPTTDVAYFKADVINATDYYAFGMQFYNRTYQSAANTASYLYGFNGKENDNEVKGTGNQQDYGMRIYDPRLGRFLSVDPIAKEYPELTPYQFASNTPIQAIDLDGLKGTKPQWLETGDIAHRAFTAYIKRIDATGIFWTANQQIMPGVPLRPDLVYNRDDKTNRPGGVWELKPRLPSPSSFMAGPEAQLYATALNLFNNTQRFTVGTTGGTPAPFTESIILTDDVSGRSFSYTLDGNSGAIWYNEINKKKKVKVPVEEKVPVLVPFPEMNPSLSPIPSIPVNRQIPQKSSPPGIIERVIPQLLPPMLRLLPLMIPLPGLIPGAEQDMTQFA